MEPVNTDLVRLLEQDLHAGEAESIVLALETKPDVLLLDEAEALFPDKQKHAVLQDFTIFRSQELLVS